MRAISNFLFCFISQIQLAKQRFTIGNSAKCFLWGFLCLGCWLRIFFPPSLRCGWKKAINLEFAKFKKQKTKGEEVKHSSNQANTFYWFKKSQHLFGDIYPDMVLVEETNTVLKPAVKFSGVEQYITFPAQQHASNFRALLQIMYKWYLVKALPLHLEISQCLVYFLKVCNSQFKYSH